MARDIRYINTCNSKYKTPLKEDTGSSADIAAWLIWGDQVEVIGKKGNWLEVRTRGQKGYVFKSNVGDEPLLEVYIIDVGQGDGVLYRTPDLKWHMVDAGVLNSSQMTRKGAPNFVHWKFRRDLREPKVRIANMIMSHPDYDHYGGFINILGGDLQDGRTFKVEVENFYHSGMGRFQSSPELGQTTGDVTVPALPISGHGTPRKAKLIHELLSDKDSFKNPKRKFKGRFEDLAELVGSVPKNVAALSAEDGFVPGYAPGENKVTMKLLGPIIESGGGKKGLRSFSSGSKTRNGHSVIVRLDYGKAKILLTGDSNEESQRLTLSNIDAEEFKADVAKGCHHGSEDIYLKFIEKMAARATVISSGDNEDYAHPRPVVMGASAFYGREIKDQVKNMVNPPLIYSTELSRSVKLANPTRLKIDGSTTSIAASKAEVKSSTTSYKDLDRTPIATDLIYGLVNVRTDGKEIMCATMEEKGQDFDLKVFKAG
jgi:beta-lactamase superfamily II metal-dependent hydrolase